LATNIGKYSIVYLSGFINFLPYLSIHKAQTFLLIKKKATTRQARKAENIPFTMHADINAG
jgi:hypothetical protein